MSEARVCIQGHRFVKSSDCPVCPFCEAEKVRSEFFKGLSAPACRALETAGIENEIQLSAFTEQQLLKLHGMGKSGLRILREKLNNKGLEFKS